MIKIKRENIYVLIGVIITVILSIFLFYSFFLFLFYALNPTIPNNQSKRWLLILTITLFILISFDIIFTLMGYRLFPPRYRLEMKYGEYIKDRYFTLCRILYATSSIMLYIFLFIIGFAVSLLPIKEFNRIFSFSNIIGISSFIFFSTSLIILCCAVYLDLKGATVVREKNNDTS